MVKVRFSHLQSPDWNNLNLWLANISNQKFRQDLQKHYDFYHDRLFTSKDLLDEVKLQLLAASCELVEILDTLNLDEDTLLAAFYFPVVSHGVIKLEDLREMVSPIIIKILKGTLAMSQIDIINLEPSKGDQTNSIRHLLLSMADDYRSIIIKIAERIIFLRSLDNNKDIPISEKVEIATKLHSIYASLANRLGIGQLKWEIEDLCLKIENPDVYYNIVRSLACRRLERVKIVEDFERELRGRIELLNIPEFEVYGRPKHIFSIHKKMEKKNLEFGQLYDLFAARVIVQTVEECYKVLSMVQAHYEVISSEFTDYIANPKPNGYKSIHTIISLEKDGKKFPLELQIRTEEMHKLAEVGVAAHWQYKEGKKSSNKANDKIAWLRKLIEWQKDINTEDDEVTEEIRKQLLVDRVYIFTPRGEVRDLPIGATPLDFAYSIHSDVGNRCIGAKVNNKMVNFAYELKTGDKVEILTQKNPNISLDWVNFVKTKRAKSKILSYFTKLDRDKYVEAGLQLLEQTCSAQKYNYKQLLPQLLKRYKQKSAEDLCYNFGCGTLKVAPLQAWLEQLGTNSTDKAKEVDNMLLERLAQESDKQNDPSSQKRPTDHKNQIVIEGSSTVMYSIARCCQPIPGDDIVGYITKGRGVSVHKQDCNHIRHLIKEHPGRIVNCSWNKNFSGNNKMSARVKVIGLDRVGMLRDISAVLSSDKVTISSFHSQLNSKTMLSTMNFEVTFTGVDTLNRALNSISKISGVVQAIRV